MSKRLQVATAIKALVAGALPLADVRGMDAADAKPATVGAGGMAIVRSGDPGQPEIDLSPPRYNYEHGFPVELAAYGSGGTSAQAALDGMAAAIGAAIAANRFLGGLVDWLDAGAPTDGETDLVGATSLGWSDFAIVASYTTDSPLG